MRDVGIPVIENGMSNLS